MPTSLTIAGNLVEDPQVRTTNSGLEIVELRVASSEGKDKTTFWTVKFFNNKAGEIAAKYAKKGSGVFVSGRTEEESWESQDGQKRTKMVCVAETFNFLGGGKKDDEGKPVQKRAQQRDLPPVDQDDEDPPF